MNFIEKLVKPTKTDEDHARREYILNVLLLSSFFLSLAASIFTIYCIIFIPNRSGNSLSATLILPIFVLFLLFLSKKGLYKLSAVILIILLLLSTASSLMRWGVDLPQSLLTLVLLIVISSILVNTKFSFIIALIESIFIIAVGYLHNHGIIHPDTSWKQHLLALGDTVIIAITFGVITVVSWLSNREIERSLRRAWRSEADLKKERDSLEIKVEERTKELKQVEFEKMAQMAKFAEFGQLASGIFHDLLNPLTAVQLNLEHVSSDKFNKEKDTKPFIDQALMAAKRVEQFALAVNMQIKQQEVVKTFNLFTEIEQILSVLSYKARKSDVSLEVSGSKKISLKGNPLKFHQIITNIVSNAIDAYTEDKSDNKLIKIDISSTEHYVEISIEDFGKGIPEEIQGKIFDPFFTTKDLSTGTGIGLAITKNIVEKDFKGEIQLQSKTGEGTKFTLKLADAK